MASKRIPYTTVTFTLRELTKIYSSFLTRLVGMGNTRKDMIDVHLRKLVDIPYSQLIRKRPRGPSGRWFDMMDDISIETKERALTFVPK